MQRQSVPQSPLRSLPVVPSGESRLQQPTAAERRLLSPLRPPSRGWEKTRLTMGAGTALFECGHLGAGLEITNSSCHPEEPTRTLVQHTVPTALLVFGRQGDSLFSFRDGCPPVTIAAGDVWLLAIPEGTVERQFTAGRTTQSAVIRLSPDRFGEVLEEALGGDSFGKVAEPRAVRLALQDRSAPSGLDSILANPLENAHQRLAAECRALDLMGYWLSAPAGQGVAPVPLSDRGLTPFEQQAVRRVMDRLRAGSGDPPGLDLLAAEVGINHVRLNRCFRKAVGMTVFGWWRLDRLQQACTALCRPASSITAIALEYGFSSSSHFSTAFKQAFGQTPQAYRQQTVTVALSADGGVCSANERHPAKA